MATIAESVQINISTKKRCWCGTILSQSNSGDVCRIHRETAPSLPGTEMERPLPKPVVPPVAVTLRPQAQPKPRGSVLDLLQRRFTATQIVNATAKLYGVDPHSIMGKSRQHPIGIARQVSAYLICKYVDGASLSWTGHDFLKQHHTTVMHSCGIIRQKMARNEVLGKAVDAIWKNSSLMPGDSYLTFPFENSQTLSQ